MIESVKMICLNCIHAVIGNTKGDKAMASIGYRSCAASETPEELGRYLTGGNRCIYPDRFKGNTKERN